MLNSPSRPKAFVLMPFDPEFEAVYSQFISTSLTQAGFEVFRAKDIHSVQNILHAIIESIHTSDLIIADLTGSNPNVFYELGIAHALHRNVILLTQDISEVPFDLKPYRLIGYSTHFAEIETAKMTLEAYGRESIEGTLRFGSPVSDFFAGKPQPPIFGVSTDVTVEDDRGILDHIEIMEDFAATIGEILPEIGREMGGLTNATSEISRHLNDPPSGSGVTAFLRKRSREYAEKLLSFTSKMEQLNGRYRLLLEKSENSLEFIVSFNKSPTEEQANRLQELILSARGAIGTSKTAHGTYVGLAEPMNGLLRLERHVTRALRLLSEQIRQFAGYIEQTSAAFARAVDVGERILAGNSKTNP